MEIIERNAKFNPSPAGNVGVQLDSPRPDGGSIRCKPLAEFLNTPDQRYLLKGIIPDGQGVGTIYGAPGSGKSFFTLDFVVNLSRCDADRPTHWHGHRLAPKSVPSIVVVAEGQAGFTKRLHAALEHYHLTVDDLLIEIVDCGVSLQTSDTDDLITAIRDSGERIGRPGLVVVDTLAATLLGDENNSEDMGSYLSAVRRLAMATGAFQWVVHHSGKDATRGARGHSSLRGAVDVELEIVRDASGARAMICRKSRDDADGEEIGFRLDVINLGTDADGDPRTSCVVVPSTETPTAKTATRLLSGVARIGLDSLREVIADRGQRMTATSTIPGDVLAVRLEDWRQQFCLRYGKDDGAKKTDTMTKAHRRAKDQLFERKLIAISDPWVWATT